MSEVGESIIRGLEEALAYAQGEDVGVVEHKPSVETVDVHAIRSKLGLTQQQFADDFGFSVQSVRNWEQGLRTPNGTARVLLKVIASNPDAVREALRNPDPDAPDDGEGAEVAKVGAA